MGSHILSYIWCLQIDSYEFAEPRNIIPELKKDFWEGIESAKWSERKAACTTLKELASYPRLASGDYGDVNRELKKIISKDSNIQVWFNDIWMHAELLQCQVRVQHMALATQHKVHLRQVSSSAAESATDGLCQLSLLSACQ
jgi:hypothetical protein